jgi:putative ABC transport system permease protein
MNVAWKKAARDFWSERTRTLLVAAAIALGIAGFCAVLSSYAILVRELNRGYLATNPASATFRTDDVDDALIAAVLADPRVSDAEARRQLSGRLKAGPAEWRNLVLFVVKDFSRIRVSTLTPEKGAWPPATGEILIERDAMQVAKARIGDSVKVRTLNGTDAQLRVAGTVHDVGQAQARMENLVYGYITVDTLAQLGEKPTLDQLKILVADDRMNEQHIREVSAGVQQIIEKQGHPVRRVEIPTPGEHPHAAIMGLLLLSMASFGIFVLVLSGVLVVNLLLALMASEVRQIGVMKAVGGTRRQIARIYFAQTLLLGAASVALGLPAGIIGGRILCRTMSTLLNFDITSFAVPLWVFLLVAAVGFAAPLLAAAYPVLKGAGIPVREALADFGVTYALGGGAIERTIIRLGQKRLPLQYALRNCGRRRMRLLLTLGTLATAGLFFMSALNVRTSMIRTLDALFATRKFDLQVGLGTMYPMEKIRRATSSVPAIVRVEGWLATEGSLPERGEAAASNVVAPHGNTSGAAAIHGQTGAGSGSGGSLHGAGALGAKRFTMLAIPAGTDMIQPDLIAGRNLQPGDVDAMLVNHTLAAANPQIKVGETINVQMAAGSVAWHIVGITREPFSPAMAYVPLAFFENAGHAGMASTLRLVLDKHDPASIAAAKSALDSALEREGVRALNAASKADARFGFDEHMLMIYVFLIITSAILAGVGGLGLATTMSLNVLERRREMGVLRVLGASPRRVWSIVVIEGMLVGALSWAIASLAAWPLARGVGNLIVRLMFQSALNFSFEIRGVMIWLAVCLALGLVSSFLPAWHASRRPVREAIATE